MDPESDVPTTIGSYRIGRFYCEACGNVGAVVRDADATIICCPRCGSACVASPGAEDTIG
jgi:hypothetical protein